MVGLSGGKSMLELAPSDKSNPYDIIGRCNVRTKGSGEYFKVSSSEQ